MQRLEVSGAVQPIYGSLGVRRLRIRNRCSFLPNEDLHEIKSSPVTGLEWLRVFQESKVPRFHDNGTGWW